MEKRFGHVDASITHCIPNRLCDGQRYVYRSSIVLMPKFILAQKTHHRAYDKEILEDPVLPKGFTMVGDKNPNPSFVVF